MEEYGENTGRLCLVYPVPEDRQVPGLETTAERQLAGKPVAKKRERPEAWQPKANAPPMPDVSRGPTVELPPGQNPPTLVPTQQSGQTSRAASSSRQEASCDAAGLQSGGQAAQSSSAGARLWEAKTEDGWQLYPDDLQPLFDEAERTGEMVTWKYNDKHKYEIDVQELWEHNLGLGTRSPCVAGR